MNIFGISEDFGDNKNSFTSITLYLLLSFKTATGVTLIYPIQKFLSLLFYEAFSCLWPVDTWIIISQVKIVTTTKFHQIVKLPDTDNIVFIHNIPLKALEMM